jgi:beta-N-acetylhexosaminidase
MSRAILTGLLREQFGFQGVIITDDMDMHAIALRYGAGAAGVQALLAGADMVMATGSRASQQATLDAIAAAIADGTLPRADVEQKLARLAALALAYPGAGAQFPSEAADRDLMARAWQQALTLRGQPPRPAPGTPIRLVMRQDVVSDGVSEAGVGAAALSTLLGQLYPVELVTFPDADAFDWASLPQDGTFTVLASTARLRYGARPQATWKPDLHLALWNPYQALDIAAPAVMSYGFAPPALAAVAAWLAGTVQANGRCPVPGFL